MNDEQKRIAIAETQGWKWTKEGWVWTRDEVQPKALCHPPNYPRDLNAMAEAEITLNDQQIDEYKHRLCIAITDKERISQCATARQRAEAFLRVIEGSKA